MNGSLPWAAGILSSIAIGLGSWALVQVVDLKQAVATNSERLDGGLEANDQMRAVLKDDVYHRFDEHDKQIASLQKEIRKLKNGRK